MSTPHLLKARLLKYYKGTKCVCGKPKLPGFWECFCCYLWTNKWPEKEDVRVKCTAHTQAVKTYLDTLKSRKEQIRKLLRGESNG